jgi:hypothetical protein
VLEGVAVVVSAPVDIEESEDVVDGVDVDVAIKSWSCQRIEIPYASKLLDALVITVDSGAEPEVFVVIVKSILLGLITLHKSTEYQGHGALVRI